MKKFLLILPLLAAALSGCGESDKDRQARLARQAYEQQQALVVTQAQMQQGQIAAGAAPQVQYAQPVAQPQYAPAPAAAPVIINQAPAASHDSGVGTLATGMLLGHMMTNSGGSNGNGGTVVNKTVINRTVVQAAPTPYTAPTTAYAQRSVTPQYARPAAPVYARPSYSAPSRPSPSYARPVPGRR